MGYCRQNQKTQNNMLRVLYSKKRRDNIDYLYKEKDITKCYNLYLNQQTKMAWEIITGKKRSNIELKESNVRIGSDRHGKILRKFEMKKTNTKWGDRSARNIMTKILNYLEKEIKLTTDQRRREIYPKKEIKRLWNSKTENEIDNFIGNQENLIIIVKNYKGAEQDNV